MTPAQITAAAHELCRLRGENADEVVSDSDRGPLGTRWQFATEEIQRFAQVGTAIAAALQQEEKPTRRKKGLDTTNG
jgi:hypothetical protein